MSLKCLAAQSIRKYNLDYQGQVIVILIIIMVLIYVIRPTYTWTPKFHDDFLLGSQVPREFHPHPRALRSLISFLFGLLSPQEIKTEGSLTSKHLQIFFVCHSAYHLNSPMNLHSCLHKIYILIYWICGIVALFIKDMGNNKKTKKLAKEQMGIVYPPHHMQGQSQGKSCFGTF